MTPAALPLLATPDAALLAVLAGILLLYAEFNVPGTVLPGCFGMFLLMLGLFAFSRLPLHPAFLAAALAGFALLLLAIFIPHHLLPTALGWAMLTYSLIHLVPPSRTTRGIDLPTALFAASLFSAATVWLGRIALRARRNKQLPMHAPAQRAE